MPIDTMGHFAKKNVNVWHFQLVDWRETVDSRRTLKIFVHSLRERDLSNLRDNYSQLLYETIIMAMAIYRSSDDDDLQTDIFLTETK